MIDLEVALKSANKYFLEQDGIPVTTVLDAETHWIFYAMPDNKPQIGSAGIKVDKATGELADFILPDDDNFELLDKAEEIELPSNPSGRKFFVVQ